MSKKMIFLSISIFIGMLIVGCSRMSNEEMNKYCDYESDVENMNMNSNQIKKRVDEYIEKFDIPGIQYTLRINSDDLERYKDELKEFNNKLNSMDIGKFKRFYENAPEYRGSSEKEEQDNYEDTKKKVFNIKRKFAYYSEIIPYILDNKITESESKEIKQLQELSLYHIDNETLELFPTRFTDEDIKKQNDIYEKYSINKEELDG